MRLVAAEGDPLVGHEERPDVRQEKGDENQPDDPPAERPGQENIEVGPPFRFSCLIGLGDPDDFEIENGRRNRDREKTEPFQKIVSGQIMSQGQGGEQKESDRRVGWEIEGQSLFIVEPAVFRPDVADESPDPDQKNKNQDGRQKEGSDLGTERMVFYGERGELVAQPENKSDSHRQGKKDEMPEHALERFHPQDCKSDKGGKSRDVNDNQDRDIDP